MRKRVDQQQRAKRAWDILIKIAREHCRTTYGELGKRLGTHAIACRFFLEHIQEYCRRNNLPPLHSLVVNKATGRPGEGCIVTRTGGIEDVHRGVFTHDWEATPNPF